MQVRDSVAFVFVRAATDPSLKRWLPRFAADVAPIGTIHLVLKSPLAKDDAAIAAQLPGVILHHTNASRTEAGPLGGRECSGYLHWLLSFRDWNQLPAWTFFMHGTLDVLNAARLETALQSSRGFEPIIPRRFSRLSCLASSSRDGARHKRGSKPGTLPESLKPLFASLKLPMPDCVSAPCCASFRLRRDAVRGRSRADLHAIADYARTPLPLADRGRRLPVDSTGCHGLESVWHVLFGSPPLMLERPDG